MVARYHGASQLEERRLVERQPHPSDPRSRAWAGAWSASWPSWTATRRPTDSSCEAGSRRTSRSHWRPGPPGRVTRGLLPWLASERHPTGHELP